MLTSSNFLDPVRGHSREQYHRSTYQLLAECQQRGVALRNVRADDRGLNLDIFLALEEVAYFGILVREARYCRVGHHCLPDWGQEGLPEVDPFEEVSRCVEGICALVHSALDFQPAVVSVLILTGMEPDPSISSMARPRGVGVLWKPERLVENLVSLAEGVQTDLCLPPTAGEIADVAQVLLTRIHDKDTPGGFPTILPALQG